MPGKNGEPTIKERMAIIETHYEHIASNIGEIKEAIKEEISPLLQNHDRRITRNSTILKLLIGLSASGGGLYGLINFLA